MNNSSSRLFHYATSPMLALVLALAVVFAVHASDQKRLDAYKAEQASNVAALQKLVGTQGAQIEELNSSLLASLSKNQASIKEAEAAAQRLANDLAAEKARRSALESQQLSEQNQTQKSIQGLKDTISKSATPDLSQIINFWDSRMAQVECDFADNTAQLGSGTLNGVSGKVNVVTNKHVVLGGAGERPVSCKVRINGTSVAAPDLTYSAANDKAFITLGAPSAELKALAANFPQCSMQAKVGDEVVILGYPAIGSATDVTATEGIISGTDSDYYITSAKVERGNSGGAAILAKNNCYLGIPTFARAGQVESLARILKREVVFP